MKVTTDSITPGQLRALEVIAERLAADARMALLGTAVTPALKSEIRKSREQCAQLWNRLHGETP